MKKIKINKNKTITLYREIMKFKNSKNKRMNN